MEAPIATLDALSAISIDALIARREADPVKAALLAQARQRLAGELPVSPLAALRMRYGLSQRALAERCGMGQPHVAKIEQATHDPKTSTVQRMAEAMGCAAEEVLRAVLETQSWARRP